MAAVSTVMTVSGSAVAAPATRLSSSAAFGSSGAQQLGAVRSPASFNASRIVAARASHNSEELQTPVKSKVLVALVAAGAAFALNAAPVSPAYAGFFGGDVKVERGATAPDFPGNEGAGTKVGNNSDVRGSANSGTPLGEGAGGNLVGDNQSTRQLSSTGTPLGEGSTSGSGLNVGAALKGAPDVGGLVENVNPLKNIGDVNPLKNIGDVNPLKGGLPDASDVASDAKNAAQNLAGDAKSKVQGGLPDASNVASDAKNAAQNLAGDAKSKVQGGLPDASSVASDAKNAAQNLAGDAKSKVTGTSNPIESGTELASNVASSDGVQDAKNAAGDIAKNATENVATNSAQDLAESAKSKINLPNPMEAGKALMSKVGAN